MLDLDSKRILVIAPHHDDELIGCGGTLLKFRGKIERLSIIHMIGSKVRDEEFTQVKKFLSTNKNYNLGLEDGFIGSNSRETTLRLIKIIQLERPDIIFIPHELDNHPDHKATYEIAIDAIGKSRHMFIAQYKVPEILFYEIWSFMHKVSEVVDITEYLDQKIELMKFYESQNFFQYDKYIEIVNGYRGLIHNYKGYAEAFLKECL